MVCAVGTIGRRCADSTDWTRFYSYIGAGELRSRAVANGHQGEHNVRPSESGTYVFGYSS
jgi:hypothetical protein